MQKPDYKMMLEQLKALVSQDPNYVTALSSAAALLWESLEDINWAGFYLVREEILAVGPYQGKIACIHIPKGKGVCGTAWEKNEIQLVPDVHAFPGHIACDSASNSEIVLPILHDGTVAAVMDIDSPSFSRFSEEDRDGLALLCDHLSHALIW
jgi:GAF domain-containing protein